MPLPAVVGAVATFTIWIIALATHPAARYAGPAWLRGRARRLRRGRVSHGEGLIERVVAPDEHPVRTALRFTRILVPMKLGDHRRGDARDRGQAGRRPRRRGRGAPRDPRAARVPLDAPMLEEEERADASLAEAKLLGADYGVTVEGATVRARAIG